MTAGLLTGFIIGAVLASLAHRGPASTRGGNYIPETADMSAFGPPPRPRRY